MDNRGKAYSAARTAGRVGAGSGVITDEAKWRLERLGVGAGAGVAIGGELSRQWSRIASKSVTRYRN